MTSPRGVPRRSPYTRVVSSGGRHLAYHALLASYVVLDESESHALGANPGDAAAGPARHPQEAPDDALRRLERAGLVVRGDDDARQRAREDAWKWLDYSDARGGFAGLSLTLTQQCNLACTYCVRDRAIDNAAAEAAPTPPVRRMTASDAIHAVDEYAAQVRSSGSNRLQISFNGSEALANAETLLAVVDHAERAYADTFDLRFHLNTNATLVTEEIAERLASASFSVFTSLDGPERAHDRQRPNKAGHGSYHSTVRGQRTLRDHGVRISGPLTVITDDNLHDIDADYLASLIDDGYTVLTLEPDMLSVRAIPASRLARHLVTIHRAGAALGLRVAGSWLRPFETLMSGGERRVPLVPYCGSQAGTTMAVDAAGTVTACTFAARPLGTIASTEDAYERALAHVWRRFPGNIPECRGCEIEGLCRGGCYVVAENAEMRSEREVWEYRCDLYRAATRLLIEDFLTSRATAGGEPEPEPTHRASREEP